MNRRSKRTRQRRKCVKTLDDYVRQLVFARDRGVCVRCGKDNIQWAHVFPREHLYLRWELDNTLSLCNGCHLFWHHEPLLAVDWFRKNFGERYDRIMAIAAIKPKVNPAELLETIQEIRVLANGTGPCELSVETACQKQTAKEKPECQQRR